MSTTTTPIDALAAKYGALIIVDIDEEPALQLVCRVPDRTLLDLYTRTLRDASCGPASAGQQLLEAVLVQPAWQEVEPFFASYPGHVVNAAGRILEVCGSEKNVRARKVTSGSAPSSSR